MGIIIRLLQNSLLIEEYSTHYNEKINSKHLRLYKFEITPAFSFSEQQEYYNFIKNISLKYKFETKEALKLKLNILKNKKNKEIQKNSLLSKINMGKPIYYGDKFCLKHCDSGLYIFENTTKIIDNVDLSFKPELNYFGSKFMFINKFNYLNNIINNSIKSKISTNEELIIKSNYFLQIIGVKKRKKTYFKLDYFKAEDSFNYYNPVFSKLNKYCYWKIIKLNLKKSNKYIHSLDLIYISHNNNNGVIQNDPKNTDFKIPNCYLNIKHKNDGYISINSVFQIELIANNSFNNISNNITLENYNDDVLSHFPTTNKVILRNFINDKTLETCYCFYNFYINYIDKDKNKNRDVQILNLSKDILKNNYLYLQSYNKSYYLSNNTSIFIYSNNKYLSMNNYKQLELSKEEYNLKNLVGTVDSNKLNLISVKYVY